MHLSTEATHPLRGVSRDWRRRGPTKVRAQKLPFERSAQRAGTSKKSAACGAASAANAPSIASVQTLEMASRPIGEKPVPPAPPSTPTVPSVLAAAPKLTLPSAEDWPLPLPNSPSPEQLPPMPPSWDEEDGQDPREMLVRIAPPGSGGSVASATRPALPSGASSSSLELDSHQPPITEAPQAATSVPRSDPQPIVKLGDELLKAAESDSLESLSVRAAPVSSVLVLCSPCLRMIPLICSSDGV